MTRYKLTIEYDGGAFFGWQRQSGQISVQEVMEAAIRNFCGQDITIFAAGRTDARVHAQGQVAHIDLDRQTTPHEVMSAINAHLRPHLIAVVKAEIVADDFDARRSAKQRHYRYRIVNRRAPLTVDHGRAWLVSVALDTDAMHDAGQLLVGHHDFTSFRASVCQALSPVKTLHRLDVSRRDDEIVIEATARSFLHHQVRNMVGTLKLVGEGTWTSRDVADALAARDRAKGGPTAPPDGLYLMQVDY
ncbi:MAG: tRNA pseudouridine(38-40) synthase TruA [Pseudomonadota bacterium]|nr:tRNA pseudouridine(38-40) synthase TruA [Pseudomonadota bacterium]